MERASGNTGRAWTPARRPAPGRRAAGRWAMLWTWLAVLLAGAALLAPRTAASQVGSTRERIREAYLFGFPVYEMMRVRAGMTARDPSAGNRFAFRDRLSAAADRAVTAPNNDTLYSSAWVDLAAGPIRLRLPALPGRYHSVEFMDLFTDAYTVLGTRTGGGRGGEYLVVGPEWRGTLPAGVKLVRAPTNDSWVLARVLVDGERDLAAARAAQRAMVLDAGAAGFRPFEVPTPPAPGPEVFLDVVNAALGRGPIPAIHRDRLGRFAAVGIRPGETGAWRRLPDDVKALWGEVIGQVTAEIRGKFMAGGIRRDGWGYPAPGLAAFGTDDFYRSAVALGGLAALPAEEALYLNTTTDGRERPLDGRNRYRLRVPPGVPVGAFWSLTMYQPDEGGRFFFYDNALNRYAIGDRTAGIVREKDGSIVIAMQNEPPAPGARANWLPAPPGPFRLSFRAYLPGASFRDGRFLLPGIEVVR